MKPKNLKNFTEKTNKIVAEIEILINQQTQLSHSEFCHKFNALREKCLYLLQVSFENADNEYCAGISKTVDCNVAYFSLDENNPIIKEHCKKGGIAAIYENGFITIKKGDWKFRVGKVTHIPLTFGGRVTFMICNVLAATLASYVYGFTIEDIKLSLETFKTT